MKIAIITGASSGLGREFALQIDALKEVDEIWLVARRRDRLEEVGALLKTTARVICADLSVREGVIAVQQALEARAPHIKYLVNAAGFGKIGSYRDIPLDEIDRMIDLNCKGAVDVTQICLPYCSRGSKILEICSTAAFQPFQYLNVYAASKAFLYRYSRALNTELMAEGIDVTAVCPYWIKDTEFISVAEEGQRDAGTPSYIHGFPFAQTSQEVVCRALGDAKIGLSVSTPGLVCTVHRFAAKILSANIMMALWEHIRKMGSGSRD